MLPWSRVGDVEQLGTAPGPGTPGGAETVAALGTWRAPRNKPATTGVSEARGPSRDQAARARVSEGRTNGLTALRAYPVRESNPCYRGHKSAQINPVHFWHHVAFCVA